MSAHFLQLRQQIEPRRNIKDRRVGNDVNVRTRAKTQGHTSIVNPNQSFARRVGILDETLFAAALS
jgi:hypothetical protein